MKFYFLKLVIESTIAIHCHSEKLKEIFESLFEIKDYLGVVINKISYKKGQFMLNLEYF